MNMDRTAIWNYFIILYAFRIQFPLHNNYNKSEYQPDFPKTIYILKKIKDNNIIPFSKYTTENVLYWHGYFLFYNYLKMIEKHLFDPVLSLF